MIRDSQATTYSRQNTYSINRKRTLEFEVCDQVYLKISPMNGLMRFGKKEKFRPRYIGPYDILMRVCNVAYELKLPNDLASINTSFMFDA